MSIPRTQRQWQTVQRGLPKEALKLVQDAPVPVPRKGEVLVKISHAAITPGSWKIMTSPLVYLRRGGAVPELEASGWVVDANGTAFKNGDEVVGGIEQSKHVFGGVGTLSEYVVFQSDLLFPKPAALSMEAASGIFSNGMTAYKALVEEGHLKSGQRLFINGGTTASGMTAIQMAKILGAAEVVVSCSAESFPLVKKLGADRALDYKAAPLDTTLTSAFSNDPFDLVLDCVGHHSLFVACPAFLKSTGTFVTIAVDLTQEASWLDVFHAVKQTMTDMFLPTLIWGTPRRYIFSTTPPARHRVLDSLRWAQEGKLTNLVDSVHSSDKDGVMAAYARVVSGRAKGKVVVSLQQS